MKCRLTHALPDHASRERPRSVSPIGTIIDRPDCYKFVLLGCAEPADDECRERTGNPSKEKLDDLSMRYAAVDAGIDEEDRQAFFDGRMVGYNPDGSMKPGPNWAPDEDQEDDEIDYNDDLSLLEE